MQYIIILIWIIVFVLTPQDCGYYTGGPAIAHLYYQFDHASILHLLFNSITFLALFRTLAKVFSPFRVLLAVYLSSVLASCMAPYPIPCVGASGINYALMGIYLDLMASRRLYISPDKKTRKAFWLFLVMVCTGLSFSAAKENSAFLLHLLCLIMGAVFITPNIKFFKS